MKFKSKGNFFILTKKTKKDETQINEYNQENKQNFIDKKRYMFRK